MKKVIILGALLLSVTIPVLTLADQSVISTEATISGNTASVLVHSGTALPNSLLDLELYDVSGNKVVQAYANADIVVGTLSCSWDVAAPAGAYTLRVGVFSNNWSTLYNWNNLAATSSGTFTGSNTISCNGTTVPATFISSGSVQGTTAGSNGTFTTTVQATAAASNVLVDTEIFDSSNHKVGQWFETHSLDANSPLAVVHQSTLPSAGNYFIKVGLFSPDWSTLYSWNNAAGTFTTVAATSSGGGVNPPPPPSTNVGVINPATQTVQPGASVDFSGRNFGHEENVLIARAGTAVGMAHADGGGNFSTGSMSMPNANGTYVLTFTGQTSGTIGTSTIQIGPVTPPQSDFSFSIANSNAVPAHNITPNTDQFIGSFTTVSNESITMPKMILYVATSSGGALLTNISLIGDLGSVYAGPYDAKYDPISGKEMVTFDGSLFIPSGMHTWTIKAKIPANYVNNSTFNLITNPATDWGPATGNTSGTVETLPNTTVTLNTMTVQTGSVAVNLAPTPVPQSITSGAGILFANIQLDATASGEDTRMSYLPVSFAGNASDVSGCQLKNGSTILNTGSRVINTLSTSDSNTFSFDNSLTVPKGTLVTLQLACNVSSTAAFNDTLQFGVNKAYSYNFTGVQSGNTIIPLVTTNAGPVMTVQSSSLVGSTDSSAPSYLLVAGGTTGVSVNVLKFRAINEPIVLQKIGLKLTSGSAQDLTAVNLYAGNNIQTTSGVSIPANTFLGSATFIGNSISATSTLANQIQLPKDIDATIMIKADIADIGTNQPGTEGDLVAVDYLNAQGTGSNSGITVNSMQSGPGVAGVRMVNTLPAVSIGPGPLIITGGSNQVLEKFNLTASAFGSLGLSKLNFAIATTSLAVTNLQLHAYTDTAYSSPANVPGSVGGQFGATVDAVTNAGVVNFQQTTNPFEISAGSTIYFALTGNVATASGATTWSVASTLLGDTAFDGMKQASIVSGNFVWSPNATGTAAISQNDWINGFGVAGLSSLGLTQTRSN